MMRSPCVRCGAILHTGEGRITVSFSLDELEDLATATRDRRLAERLTCAIGLLDEAREKNINAAIAEVHA